MGAWSSNVYSQEITDSGYLLFLERETNSLTWKSQVISVGKCVQQVGCWAPAAVDCGVGTLYTSALIDSREAQRSGDLSRVAAAMKFVWPAALAFLKDHGRVFAVRRNFKKGRR
jgi:hypothetical protein